MNELGKRLTQTLWAKILWWAILTLALFVGALCCAGVLLSYDRGCYSRGVESYYDTGDCKVQLERMADTLMSHYASDGLTADASYYEADQTNLRFRISQFDADGSLLAAVRSNDDHSKTQRGALYYFVCADDPAQNGNGVYFSQLAASRDTLKSGGEPAPVSDWLLQQLDTGGQGQTAQAGPDADDGSSETDDSERAAASTDTAPAGTDAAPAPQNALYLLELDLTDPITVPSGSVGGLLKGYQVFNFLYSRRFAFFAGIGLCALAGLASLVALGFGAGRRYGREGVALCWFDKIPMELSFVGLALCCALTTVITVEVIGVILSHSYLWNWHTWAWQDQMAAVWLIAAMLTLYVVAFVVWALSFVRAAKTGHPLRGFLTARFAGWVLGAAHRCALAPKTALLVGGFGLADIGFWYLNARAARMRAELPWAFWLTLLLVWGAVTAACVYLATGLQKLRDGAKRIAAGDYTQPIDTRGMPYALREHAETLEHIASGLNTAVEQRLKSERMKTELITNVSHDLKTPLTNIINYTDLLQSQPLPEKAAEYAEVLARQGARLKKLTEDLVEASKASSGAMSCTLAPASLAELCEQALGEYSARLEKADLAPVLTMPESGLWANVDGRLVWRVLDNLLGNACKYAQPGTRLYLSGEEREGQAVVTVKNISRDALNVTAEELLERFVRGDSARSTEGSGLGLSIARSLCELQGGRFGLKVDGDLFKAELSFALCAAPAAQNDGPAEEEPAGAAGAGETDGPPPPLPEQG